MNRQTLGLIVILVALAVGLGFIFIKKHSSTPAVTQEFSIKDADTALAEGRLADGRKIYQDALSGLENNPQAFSDAKKKIEELNMKIMFSPTIDENSEEYEVKPGDSLTKISKKYAVTIDLIKKANNLEGDNLRLGQKLKIITAKFSLYIDKSQNILELRVKDNVIKTYVISTGTNNSTPVGEFKVINKLVDPTWFRAGAVVAPGDEKNALGARWLGLDVKGYGIHGTIEPDKMGQQVTLGCVRMLNDDVIELYSLVPVGTAVTIVD
jgi:lipoprotein-anchoring transpeptidase ErfK/SrfK